MQSRQWKKIGLAAVVGVSLGVVSATFSMHGPSFAQRETTTPYMVPVVATSQNLSADPEEAAATVDSRADAQELERLKTRNRRLEALVTVLRHRASERQQ